MESGIDKNACTLAKVPHHEPQWLLLFFCSLSSAFEKCEQFRWKPNIEIHRIHSTKSLAATRSDSQKKKKTIHQTNNTSMHCFRDTTCFRHCRHRFPLNFGSSTVYLLYHFNWHSKWKSKVAPCIGITSTINECDIWLIYCLSNSLRLKWNKNES